MEFLGSVLMIMLALAVFALFSKMVDYFNKLINP